MGRAKFVGADDCIILEDESARMKLHGQGLPVGQLVTGVVMVVKGVAVPGGDFHVNVSARMLCIGSCSALYNLSAELLSPNTMLLIKQASNRGQLTVA